MPGTHAHTPAASPPDPSTPPPPSAREALADLLHKSLSAGFCEDCTHVLERRIRELASTGFFDSIQIADNSNRRSSPSSFYSAHDSIFGSASENSSSPVVDDECSSSSNPGSSASPGSNSTTRRGHAPSYPSPARGLPPVPAQEGDLSEALPPKSTSAATAVDDDDLVEEDKLSDTERVSLEPRERARCSQVGRKKNFVLMERVEGRMVNVLQGLELHTGVFNAKEQKKIVDCVYSLQRLGDAKKLRGRTYSRPKKWMRGKGRVTIQFGCCYNYAVDKDGNPPGIVQDEEVDPLPALFQLMIRRMVKWHVLPSSCIPNSCIVNIYDEGDCIPPHIDHHDFVRPFCTVSFLSECNILFGSNLKAIGPGEFSGPTAIPLPIGSVLVLKGNGADVAKHCVPGVPTKRISITFRKMDDSRLPYDFSINPNLQCIQPLQLSPSILSERQALERNQHHVSSERQHVKPQPDKIKNLALQSKVIEVGYSNSFSLEQDDFPPLGDSSTTNKNKTKRSTT